MNRRGPVVWYVQEGDGEQGGGEGGRDVAGGRGGP